MIQLILHLVGDYCTQSDWMARNKTNHSWPAFCHAALYSVPFLLLTTHIPALLCIFGTHFLIDRFRLARYLVWAKNLLAPRWTWFCDSPESVHDPTEPTDRCDYCRKVRTLPWASCTATGYPPESPAWLAVWLLIVADNTIHLGINYAALRWL